MPNSKWIAAFVVLWFAYNGTLFSQTSFDTTTRLITLPEVIQFAQANNLELRMAKKDSAISREYISDARMDRAPSITAGAYYNYIGNPILYRSFYSNDTTIDYYNHQAGWSVALGVPLYTGGKINTRIAQEQVSSEIQNEILGMTASQIHLSAINQFYTLYKLYKEVEIIEYNISSIKVRIKQLQSRVANGQNLVSDLTRTELQLSNFEINVFKTRSQIVLVSGYLSTFIGLPDTQILEPQNVVVEIPPDTIAYEKCLMEAFANRNEIKQSELQRDYSELSLRMTRTNMKPVISGSAIYNSEMPVPGTFPPEENILNYWAFGLGLSYEISSLYNLNHRIKADKLQIERDYLNIENTKNFIINDVKTAYVNFLESKRNVETYQKNVELADLNYRIVKSKYDNEFALIIDMIDAEAQVNDARISLNNAIVDAISQYYNLLHAMGQLN